MLVIVAVIAAVTAFAIGFNSTSNGGLLTAIVLLGLAIIAVWPRMRAAHNVILGGVSAVAMLATLLIPFSPHTAGTGWTIAMFVLFGIAFAAGWPKMWAAGTTVIALLVGWMIVSTVNDPTPWPVAMEQAGDVFRSALNNETIKNLAAWIAGIVFLVCLVYWLLTIGHHVINPEYPKEGPQSDQRNGE